MARDAATNSILLLRAAVTCCLVTVIVLAVASAGLYHLSARLNKEAQGLRMQLALAQLHHLGDIPDFPAKQQLAQTLAEQALAQRPNATSGCRVVTSTRFTTSLSGSCLCERDADVTCAALPPPAERQGERVGRGGGLGEPGWEGEEATSSLHQVLKYVVLVLLLSLAGMGLLLHMHLDSLPASIRLLLESFLGGHDSTGSRLSGTPLRKLVAYRIDGWFSRQPYSKPLALLYLTIVLVVVGSLSVYAVGSDDFHTAFWEAVVGVGIDWTFSSDALHVKGIKGFIIRCVALLVSIGGMLITALMLGIVSEAISEKVDDLKKGRSEVLESSHSLLLGWSDKVVPIVDQICQANESEGGMPIVILAEMEKEEMEKQIAQGQINLRGSTVICRSGYPLLTSDLRKVSVHRARSIIVLANSQSPEQSDARALRIVLSLMGEDVSPSGGLVGHIVVELCDVDNEVLIKMVGGRKVETVVAHDIIGRLMIQCARQPGLAQVWDKVMGFEGNEFYLKHWPQLEGLSWREVYLSFADAIPLGVKMGRTGEVKLNPDDDYCLQPADEVLVLAEDDDTYAPFEPKDGGCPLRELDAGSCPVWKQPTASERILFCGWRRDMHDMIRVLDAFVPQGSELLLYSEVPLDLRSEMLRKGGLDPVTDLRHLRLRYQDPQLLGEAVTRKKLEALHPWDFTSILILADESAEGVDIADADSRNLATLLLVRDIQMRAMAPDTMEVETRAWTASEVMQGAVSQTVVISEILDSRTRQLIKDLRISEFVLSNELVSMMLAMVSERAEVNTILGELFTDEGNEMYVQPAEKYINPGELLCFWEVMIRGRQRRELVMGFRSSENDPPVLNPAAKSQRHLSLDIVHSFVVMAENDEMDEVASGSSGSAHNLHGASRDALS